MEGRGHLQGDAYDEGGLSMDWEEGLGGVLAAFLGGLGACLIQGSGKLPSASAVHSWYAARVPRTQPVHSGHAELHTESAVELMNDSPGHGALGELCLV